MSQRELVADPGQEPRFPVTHRLPETLSGDPCVSRWGTKVGDQVGEQDIVGRKAQIPGADGWRQGSESKVSTQIVDRTPQ